MQCYKIVKFYKIDNYKILKYYKLTNNYEILKNCHPMDHHEIINNYRIIRNNSINPISINGILLNPNIKTILKNTVVKNIDPIYFTSNILTDLGKYIDNNFSVIDIDTYYKKPQQGISKNDLSVEVRNALTKAEHSISYPIKLEYLDSSITDLLNKPISTTNYPNLGYIKIDRNMLATNILDTLNLAQSAYQKLDDGIPFDDLSSDLQQRLNNNNIINNQWKLPVRTFTDLPLNNTIGDLCLTLNDFTIWVWDGLTWQDVYNNNFPINLTTPDYNFITINKILYEIFISNNNIKTINIPQGIKINTSTIQIYHNGRLLDISKYTITQNINQTYNINFIFDLIKHDYIVLTDINKNPYGLNIYNHKIVDLDLNNINWDKKTINLPFSYESGMLLVWVNGLLKTPDEGNDYIEISPTSIQFNFELHKDDIINIRLDTGTLENKLLSNIANLRQMYLNLNNQVQKLSKIIEKNNLI